MVQDDVRVGEQSYYNVIHPSIIPWALARWGSLHSWLSVSRDHDYVPSCWEYDCHPGTTPWYRPAILGWSSSSRCSFQYAKYDVSHQSGVFLSTDMTEQVRFLSKMTHTMFFVVPTLGLISFLLFYVAIVYVRYVCSISSRMLTVRSYSVFWVFRFHMFQRLNLLYPISRDVVKSHSGKSKSKILFSKSKVNSESSNSEFLIKIQSVQLGCNKQIPWKTMPRSPNPAYATVGVSIDNNLNFNLHYRTNSKGTPACTLNVKMTPVSR